MTGGDPAVVRVAPPPPDNVGYDVIVREGALSELPAHVIDTGAARCVVVADATVADLYGDVVMRLLRAAVPADLLTFAAGEAHKTRTTWTDISDRMLALRCGRDACVVALGGGVTGDLAGFVAATYMRGVPFIQVPTTLLAMIDASVGGKTGVDTPAGKNLIGAFHTPRVVLADTAVLRTLPPMERRAGLAEAVKHGAIVDRAYFDWIGNHAEALLAAEPDTIEQLVRRSVQLKAAVVAADPLEHGERAVLNFGHTVGHALELRSGYGLLHGYAVAIGMTVEAALGESLGITAPGTGRRLTELLQRCGLPVAPASSAAGGATTAAGSATSAAGGATSAADVLHAMGLDKKARAARSRFVLLADIGRVARGAAGEWTHDVPDQALLHALETAIRAGRVV